jgi:signal transduction histidine kinase
MDFAVLNFLFQALTASSDLRGHVLAGIAEVITLLAQCNVYQQVYMAAEPGDRPPTSSLNALKESMVQVYKDSQLFLSYAVRHRSIANQVLAPFKLDDVQAHIRQLSKSEDQLQQTADACERHSSLSNRAAVRELTRMSSELHQILSDQFSQMLA